MFMKPDGEILPICLTIAGSDSGGGAGIQADLKTFASMDCYGVSVVTSVTAQNTKGVDDIHVIPTFTILNQLKSIMSDMKFSAVKTGMIPEKSIVESVVDNISCVSNLKLVVDPVIVSTSGHKLISDEAINSIRSKLFPIAKIITPNLPEAEVLISKKISSKNDIKDACKSLIDLGPKSVVIKGAHFFDSKISEDIFYDGHNFEFFSEKRIETTSTHGTGCTFSAAIVSMLAKNYSIIDSVSLAKKYVTKAIDQAYKIGEGNGPLNHFFS